MFTVTTVLRLNGNVHKRLLFFFKKQLEKNKFSFLLILTQDKNAFKQIVDSCKLDSTCYKILTVEHADIYRYLSACDSGLIFREKNIINWVSRPTKVLEYQSVDLKIIHNHTIALLCLNKAKLV